jgi:hypothetical protein
MYIQNNIIIKREHVKLFLLKSETNRSIFKLDDAFFITKLKYMSRITNAETEIRFLFKLVFDARSGHIPEEHGRAGHR